MGNISYELLLYIMKHIGAYSIQQKGLLEQIKKIDKIEITGVDSIEGIEILENLKELSIKSYDHSKILWDVDVKFNPKINKIKDFSSINKLKKLETLIITNDIFIKKLDVSKLKNLKKLIIINNPGLEEIKGLDTLTNLEEVIIYGNKIKQTLNIQNYMNNTLFTSVNILDIDFYLNIVKKYPMFSQYISDCFFKGETNVCFAERSGLMDYTITYPDQLEDMYKKIITYFKREKVFELSCPEKIRFVYNYIMRNTKFNKAELIQRNNYYHSMSEYEKEILKRKLTFLHNGYSTYRFKAGNCEGRVNLMHFMLSLLNVDSTNVHCIDRRSKGFTPNHSILRIDGCQKYIDPSYNSFEYRNKYEYFMLEASELQDTHILSAYERILAYQKKLSKAQKEGNKCNGNIRELTNRKR